jgi:lysozyme
VRGAYHFGRPATDANAQAEYFVSVVRSAGGFMEGSSLPLVLDLEQADGLGPPAVWAWTQTFMRRLQSLTGHVGIIYVGKYFWQDQVGNPSDSLGAPLWLPAYGNNPRVPAAWSAWTFWQWTDKWSCPGVAAGGLDGNYFAGSEAQLHAMCMR